MQIGDTEMTGLRQHRMAVGEASGWTFCLSALQLGEQTSYLWWDCEHCDASASITRLGANRRVGSSSLPAASGPADGLKLPFTPLQAAVGPERFV